MFALRAGEVNADRLVLLLLLLLLLPLCERVDVAVDIADSPAWRGPYRTKLEGGNHRRHRSQHLGRGVPRCAEGVTDVVDNYSLAGRTRGPWRPDNTPSGRPLRADDALTRRSSWPAHTAETLRTGWSGDDRHECLTWTGPRLVH